MMALHITKNVFVADRDIGEEKRNLLIAFYRFFVSLLSITEATTRNIIILWLQYNDKQAAAKDFGIKMRVRCYEFSEHVRRHEHDIIFKYPV